MFQLQHLKDIYCDGGGVAVAGRMSSLPYGCGWKDVQSAIVHGSCLVSQPSARVVLAWSVL